MERQLIQGQNYYLQGGGIGLTGSTINVLGLVFANPTMPTPVPITMSMFGTDSIGYATLEPETPREENISFTSITFQGNNTWTLGGVVRGLPLRYDYYTPDTATIQPHAGGSLIRFTDNMANMGMLTNRWNSEVIHRPWGFTADQNPHYITQPSSFANLDLIDKQYADGSYLKVDGSNQMNANLNFGNHRGINLADPINPLDAVNLETLEATAIAGATPATMSQGGLVKVATQAEFDNTTDTTMIGPLTYYNMATISEIKQVGSSPFVYGEDIAARDYVFQATGDERIDAFNHTLSGANSFLIASTRRVGTIFTTDARAQTLTDVWVSLSKSNTPSGNVVVEIWNIVAGLPSGGAIASLPVISVASLPGGTGLIQKLTFGSPFTLPTAGTATDYAIVFNVAGVTFGGGDSIDVGSGAHFTSTNSGATWITPGGNTYFDVFQTFTTPGLVYAVDLVTPILNMGPYKGFAKATGLSGSTNPVQLINVIGGFTSLTPEQNVYIDSSVVGGITQIQSGNGRCVGIAINSTTIQISEMKTVDLPIGYASGTIINQDGFLMGSLSDSGGGATISQTDAFGNSTIIMSNITSGGITPFTIPVKAGYSYDFAGNGGGGIITFVPIING